MSNYSNNRRQKKSHYSKRKPVELNNIYRSGVSKKAYSSSKKTYIDNNKSPSKTKKSLNNDNLISRIKGSRAFQTSISGQNIFNSIIIILWKILSIILVSIIYLLEQIFNLIVFLCRKFKIAKYIFIVLAIILLYFLIDFILFNGKIYPGVSVGEVDVGNMSVETATQVLSDTYSPRLESNNVIIYVSDEAKNEGVGEHSGSGITEQLSVEQAKQTVKYWKVSAQDLDATVPAEQLAQDAYNTMRGGFPIIDRISSIFIKKNINPYVNYSEAAINSCINKINDTIGKQVINPTVIIENANASAKDGEDGNLLHNSEFITNLNTAFLCDDPNDSNFVANLHPAYQQISYNCANELASKLNNSLASGANFTYKDTSWTMTPADLSSLIEIKIENKEDENKGGCSCSGNESNYCILAKINSTLASQSIYNQTRKYINSDSNVNISFDKDDSNILVKPDKSIEMPTTSPAIEQLNNEWLKNPISYTSNTAGRKSGCVEPNSENVNIVVSSAQIPESLSFDDALSLGLINQISTYTTTYSSGAGTENRNYNIDLVSSRLNNSICKSEGSTWSFNNIAGECSTETGFKEAGTVVGSTYTKEAGGGICQVATTIFNAVYEAGYSIVERSNHDLHIASYAAGRDAAISWPKPDLIWRNDTSSDVLVKIETTGYSVIVNLYGISPNLRVESEESPWVEGEKYSTTVVVDSSKPQNSSYIQVSGSDGKSIVVKRKVYDSNNNLIREDEFKSVYKPKTEVRVIGPGDEANKLLASGEARLKKDTDNW